MLAKIERNIKQELSIVSSDKFIFIPSRSNCNNSHAYSNIYLHYIQLVHMCGKLFIYVRF